MAECTCCGVRSDVVSAALQLCVDCIRNRFDAVRPHIEQVHAGARQLFGLPETVPSAEQGRLCTLCVNECRVEAGGVGYCGLAVGSREVGNVRWYFDRLPTNCVGDWVCPGGTGCGYPDYALAPGPEYGYKNLAVFYQACSFSCLFCQNWHYREAALSRPRVSAEKLAAAVDRETACICYFGGDPTPQLPHAIRASRLALERRANRILRVCWETNGSMDPKLLDQICDISLDSGGCVKFDLKAWDEHVHFALCGASNSRTIENFRRAGKRMHGRPVPPPLIVSTLLVPGYVDLQEVEQIASFIASIDPEIPYSLLAFCPACFMEDLPSTSVRHAEECVDAALAAGLKRVKIGNTQVLGRDY